MRTEHKITVSIVLTTIATAISAAIAIPTFAQDSSFSNSISYARHTGLGTVELSVTPLPHPPAPELTVSSVENLGCESDFSAMPACTWVVVVATMGVIDAPASTMLVWVEGGEDTYLTDLPAIPASGATAYSNTFTTYGYNPFIEIQLDINDEVDEMIEDNNDVTLYLEAPVGG
jgi:hypothetical protein